MSDPAKLKSYLRTLAAGAEKGEKLPTIRQLMQEFSLSQAVVQGVLEALRGEGIITSHVGRGTFFTGADVQATPESDDKKPGAGRSVILLRRPMQNQRGRFVLDYLQEALTARGDVTLEVAYSDPDHARQVLQTLPRFDACIVQNSFDIMPLEMLSAIRRRTDTIIVDGAWLVGTDIDAVGFEWGEPIGRAVDRLIKSGHDRLYFVTSANTFLANEMGLHRYRALRGASELSATLVPEIRISSASPRAYEEDVVAKLADAGAFDQTQKTGVIIWGIENGQRFKALLAARGVKVPETMSVILLGRTDISDEHAGIFDVIGYSAERQAQAVLNRLLKRWDQPTIPFELSLQPVEEQAGHSIFTPKTG